MGVEHLDLLHDQLPELFATRELPVDWEEDFIVVRITDVESLSVGEPLTEIGLRGGLLGHSSPRDSVANRSVRCKS
jgi:hypothetical protein